jgi:hypothetical protein
VCFLKKKIICFCIFLFSSRDKKKLLPRNPDTLNTQLNRDLQLQNIRINKSNRSLQIYSELWDKKIMSYKYTLDKNKKKLIDDINDEILNDDDKKKIKKKNNLYTRAILNLKCKKNKISEYEYLELKSIFEHLNRDGFIKINKNIFKNCLNLHTKMDLFIDRLYMGVNSRNNYFDVSDFIMMMKLALHGSIEDKAACKYNKYIIIYLYIFIFLMIDDKFFLFI